jgi:Fe-S oxidoreductase
VLFTVLTLAALGGFCCLIYTRLHCLRQASPDARFRGLSVRVWNVVKYWLGQWKHPRYRFAGTLHVVIFFGFWILAANSLSLLLIGLQPFGQDSTALWTQKLTQGVTTIVFAAVLVAATRRVVFKPKRYEITSQGTMHALEPLLILGMIAILMLSESLYEASQHALTARITGNGHTATVVLSLVWLWEQVLGSASRTEVEYCYRNSYLVHQVTFFAFLIVLPFGKHFHVITSVFNVFFAKVDRHTLKPVRWDLSEEEIADLPSIGVRTVTDFTWKQLLDFYSCADCGRCSDQCPSNAVGRPLSPRRFTIKARDHSYQAYPLFGRAIGGKQLLGTIYSEEEIWSCTTCGACEEECPLLVEYIDKIVDLRRSLVDDGRVPPTLQKPLKALESRGNPYGKLEKKRADWIKQEDFRKTCEVRVVNGTGPETLYFVDSITSYDDRMQSIARATSRLLQDMGENFGILGASERDSGHEVRRFGEELLFFSLRDHNFDAIKASGAQRIVTSDPHAFNALKRDYKGLPPVEHISQAISRAVKNGRIRFRAEDGLRNTYVFHDSCYLGRHNQVYDAPRSVLDAIPGLKTVEMNRCKDRSFCCGGGGLMLFYEAKEEERMGVKRVRMAAEVGANVVVTACPFCLANIEDAIKVAGLEDSMSAIDLAELADKHVIREISAGL